MLVTFRDYACHLDSATMWFAARGNDVPPLPFGGKHGACMPAGDQGIQIGSTDQRQPRSGLEEGTARIERRVLIGDVAAQGDAGRRREQRA